MLFMSQFVSILSLNPVSNTALWYFLYVPEQSELAEIKRKISSY